MSRTIMFDKLGGPEVLDVVDTEAGDPADNEVQLAVRAAGLNRAELMFIAGNYLVQPSFPSRVGVEAAGVVTKVGRAVSAVRESDEVSVFPSIDMNRYGVIGELANVPTSALIPKPTSVSFVDAAAF